jgi:DNA topoisomerase-1
MARDLGADPVSGKPMSVRMGRFGPFVQIGTKDDEDKPRFAGLRPGQKMDSITREAALFLFQLPRKLGNTAAGEEIVANTGRFGPYVKYGPKYVSLKTDDPYTVTYERALEVIREKEIADANRLIQDFPDAGIQVLNGRYGPYVKDKTRNAKIPKDREPKSLTLEDCQALLAAAPVRGFGNKWGRKNAKAGAGPKANGSAAPGEPATPAKRARKRKQARKRTSSPAAATAAAATAPGATPASAPPAGARSAPPAPAARKVPPARPAARLAAKGSKAAAKKRAPAETAAAAPSDPKTKRRKS